MAKYFNVTGVCRPSEHYMVNLDERLAEIRKMIDRKYYFAINRGRQYGKTTTLAALKQYLQKDFIVASLDFQFLSQSDFETEQSFSAAFASYRRKRSPTGLFRLQWQTRTSSSKTVS